MRPGARGGELKPARRPGRVRVHQHLPVPLLLLPLPDPAPAHVLNGQLVGAAGVIGHRDFRHGPPHRRIRRRRNPAGIGSRHLEAHPQSRRGQLHPLKTHLGGRVRAPHPRRRDQHRHLPQARRPRGPGLPVPMGARPDRQLALGDPPAVPEALAFQRRPVLAKIASASGSGSRPSITNAFATAITPATPGTAARRMSPQPQPSATASSFVTAGPPCPGCTHQHHAITDPGRYDEVQPAPCRVRQGAGHKPPRSALQQPAPSTGGPHG